MFLRGGKVYNLMHTTLLNLQFLLQDKLHAEIRYIDSIKYKLSDNQGGYHKALI